MKKRFLSLSLVLAMLLILVTSCAGPGQKISKDNEPLTISWLGIPWFGNGQDGSYCQKLVEERFNIKIKPIFMDNNSYKTKKQVLLSTGEIPDFIYELDPGDVQLDVKNGFLMELPFETIQKYAPNVFTAINTTEPRAWLYSNVKGKNYGVTNLGYEGNYPVVNTIRADWLKNVGIDKIPETLDELHEAFKRFAQNDPDGNGKKDTYGMTGDVKNWYGSFSDIYGAFGVLPFNWMKKNDKIVYGGLQPEVKEALLLLQTWYKEGIIHPDFISDDGKSTLDKYLNGRIGFWASPRGVVPEDLKNPTSYLSRAKALNPKAEIVNMYPVKGKDGKSGMFVWGKAQHTVSFGKQLKDQPKKVEVILKIIDTCITDAAFNVKLHIGEKGTHWDLKEPSLGTHGGYKMLPPYDDSQQARKLLLSSSLGTFTFFAPFPINKEETSKYTTDSYIKMTQTYCNESLGLTDVFLKPDTPPSSGKYLTDLRSKQLEIMAQIIRGEKEVAEYDRFATIWQKQGGLTLEQEANDLKNQLDVIYKKVGVHK